MSVFASKPDRYNSVGINTAEVDFQSDEDFENRLSASLKEWRKQTYRGVWVKVALKHSSLVPVCTKLGFNFHHAQPGYVMMIQWLPEDQPNNLPEYANHYIGVGGFVINEKNELLVIQEKFFQKATIHWKLPGGHVDKGEDLADAAVREVFEETGVKCEFLSLLAFRHQHNYRFGCSDIYFICVMRPFTQELIACQQEVSKCKWIHIDEYLDDPLISDANKFFVNTYKENLSKSSHAILPTRVLSFTKKVKNNIYSIKD